MAVKGLLAAGASKAGLGVIGAGLGAYGAYTEGSTAIHHFRQGNYFQGVFHTFTAGTSAFGGYRSSAPARAATANFVRAHPRLNPANYSVNVDKSYLNSVGSLKGLKIRYNAPKGVASHVLDPWDDISRFRSRSHLIADDTLARIEVNGRRYFGVNSSAQPADALALRREFLGQIQTELGRLEGKTLNRVRALTHAEGHALMRAYVRNGGNPGKEVTIHVDRITCNFCSGENGVTLLRELMGIEKLTIVSPGRTVVLP